MSDSWWWISSCEHLPCAALELLERDDPTFMGLKNRVQVVLESRRIMDICCQMSAHLKNARFSLFSSSFLQAKSAATGIVKTSTFPPPLRKRIQVWEFLKTVSFL